MTGEPRVPLSRSPLRLGLIIGGLILAGFAVEYGRPHWSTLEVGCKSAVVSELPSPDGAFDAATIRRDCLIGPRQKFVVVRKAGDLLNELDESAQVLVARQDPSFNVSWAGPKQLDIVLSGPVSLRSWRFVWGDVTVRIDGRNAQVQS